LTSFHGISYVYIRFTNDYKSAASLKPTKTIKQ